MIKRLYKNISIKFPDLELQFKNISNRSIIFSEKPDMLAQQIAGIIFGVSYTAPIHFFTWTTHEELIQSFIEYASYYMKPDQTYGFEARTSGQNRPHTRELKVELGSKLFEVFHGSIKVDLTRPDFLFAVEVRDNYAWIYHKRFQGLDGYPQGAQKGIMFGELRFWLPDYLAIFLTMKRGVNLRPIRFITQENNPIAQDWHESFMNNFSFRKAIDIPMISLLKNWKTIFNDNLCSACVFFSENLLSKISKLKEGAGFVSGVKSVDIDGDITSESLKWLEMATDVFKIRPNLVSTFEDLERSKIFSNFPKSSSCCSFQKKRFILKTLKSDEQKDILKQVDAYTKTYFLSQTPDSDVQDIDIT